MSESTMRGIVVRALRSRDAVAVENPVCPGTPDVNYRDGWLELKQLARWPRNADVAPVLIPHYSPEQRLWLLKRTAAAGVAALLLKVGSEWLLFDGKTSAALVGRVPRPELRSRAYRTWSSSTELKEGLLPCLSELQASLRPSASSSTDGAAA